MPLVTPFEIREVPDAAGVPYDPVAAAISAELAAQAEPLKEKKKVGRPIAYKGDINSPHLSESERRRIKRCEYFCFEHLAGVTTSCCCIGCGPVPF